MTVTTVKYTDRDKTMVVVNGKEHGHYPGHRGHFFHRIQEWIEAGNAIAEPDLAAIRKQEVTDEANALIDGNAGDIRDIHYMFMRSIDLVDNKGQGALNAADQAELDGYKGMGAWVKAVHEAKAATYAAIDVASDPDSVIPNWPAQPGL